jgi:hypothetical protein
VHPQAFDAKIWIWVAKTVKAVFKDNGAGVLLLRYSNPVNY